MGLASSSPRAGCRQIDYFFLKASLIFPPMPWALPSVFCRLPLATVRRSPVAFPTASLTLPARFLPAPATRSLSIRDPFSVSTRRSSPPCRQTAALRHHLLPRLRLATSPVIRDVDQALLTQILITGVLCLVGFDELSLLHAMNPIPLEVQTRNSQGPGPVPGAPAAGDIPSGRLLPLDWADAEAICEAAQQPPMRQDACGQDQLPRETGSLPQRLVGNLALNVLFLFYTDKTIGG